MRSFLRLFTLTALLAAGTLVSAQEVKIVIAEQTGQVDFRYRDGGWEALEEGALLSPGTEIQTGLHSRVSIEIGQESYITVNQLTGVIIEKVRARKNQIFTEVALKNGYMTVLSKEIKPVLNTIVVQLEDGSVEFLNAGGDIYTRSEHGHIINSFLGKLKVISSVRAIYYLRKGMTCGITTDGQLVESDHFLRKKLVIPTGDVLDEMKLDAWFMALTETVSSEPFTTDYYRAFNP
jgi:hypothetical protein